MDLPPLPVPRRIPTPTGSLSRPRLYDSPWIRLREDRYRAPPGQPGALRGVRIPAHRLRRAGPGRAGPGGAGGPVALSPGEPTPGRSPKGGGEETREPLGGHPAGTGGRRRGSPPASGSPWPSSTTATPAPTRRPSCSWPGAWPRAAAATRRGRRGTDAAARALRPSAWPGC